MTVISESTFRKPAAVIGRWIGVLLLAGLALDHPLISRLRADDLTSVVVRVKFTDGSANLFDDAARVIQVPEVDDPPTRYIAYPAAGDGDDSIMIIFKPGADQKTANSTVQKLLQSFKDGLPAEKDRLPAAAEGAGITAEPGETSRLVYVEILTTSEARDGYSLYNIAFADVLPELKKLPSIGAATIVGNRGHVMRFKLKLDRMSSWDISAKEIKHSLFDSSMLGPMFQETKRTPQTIEYVLAGLGRSYTQEHFERICVKATPEGEVLRLKDFATVEPCPPYYNLYMGVASSPCAGIVLKLSASAEADVAMKQVREKLAEVKEKSFPADVTFEVRDKIPAAWFGLRVR